MRRNPWPYAIIGYFVVFITAMASWITFAVRNDMELVRPDYYEHEIKFQQQLDKVARTAAVRSQVSLKASGGVLELALPASEASGEVHLYRPSDAKLDQRYKLAIDRSGRQRIDIAQLEPGYWRARVSWKASGLEFYFDEPLMIGGQ